MGGVKLQHRTWGDPVEPITSPHTVLSSGTVLSLHSHRTFQRILCGCLDSTVTSRLIDFYVHVHRVSIFYVAVPQIQPNGKLLLEMRVPMGTASGPLLIFPSPGQQHRWKPPEHDTKFLESVSQVSKVLDRMFCSPILTNITS